METEELDDPDSTSWSTPHEPPSSGDGTSALGKRIAIVGRLGSMKRREATNLLRSLGAVVVEAKSSAIDWIVIGAEESPLSEQSLISPGALEASARGELEIIPEAELWQRIGLLELETSTRKYYTPAMLAQLLGVPIHVIRRWHRRGLITAVRTMHRLPYFDFQEVATAKKLAAWIASGASPKAIEQRLVDFVEVLPDLHRPLAQLSVLVEGKQVLLRQGEGLVETGGQLRFDFDALDESADDDRTEHLVFSFADGVRESPSAAWHGGRSDQHDDLLQAAFDAEDAEDLETAIDYCHAILARDGVRADICFQLGELLYRIDQPIAARERYYMAIELDDEMVEARASLATVLAETGQTELAIAAYRGVLALHPEYPDALFHLANLLQQTGNEIEARIHWQRFLSLSPDSPWAEHARRQLDD